jgi:hypothetical protein
MMRSIGLKYLLISLLCLALAPVHAGNLEGKKLIEYGNDAQNTTSVRKHVREYEATLPFDGLVINVSARSGLTLGWHMFETDRLDPADFQQAIDDLKATKFKKFTDNFIQTLSSPSSTDWFDPKWSNVAYNASLFARVAKQGGCKGIMFDAEMYTGRMWSYYTDGGVFRTDHTLDEYRQKARERGQEFIRAINKEYPDITILTLFGPSQLYKESQGNPAAFRTCPNVLLSAFYDGICEAATPQTVLIDGFENSYGFRRRGDFMKARKLILEGSPVTSLNPTALKKHLRAGFGLCPEVGLWNADPAKYSKNYLTPAGFRASANYALEYSDRYVWVYSSQQHYLDGTPPKAYTEALRLAKAGPGPGEKNPIRIIPGEDNTSKSPGYDDATTFAEMRKTMTEVFDFPKTGWKFGLDDYEVGEKDGWYNTGFNDTSWPKIMIGTFWEFQGEDYDGIAWYRRQFTAPSVQSGKRVFLAFGAVDDAAKVWLNGKYVGTRDVHLGWNIPFAFEVTKQLKPGQVNVLAVEVTDRGGNGGIWKSVKLMEK